MFIGQLLSTASSDKSKSSHLHDKKLSGLNMDSYKHIENEMSTIKENMEMIHTSKYAGALEWAECCCQLELQSISGHGFSQVQGWIEPPFG